jgi:ribosomal protein S3AE
MDIEEILRQEDEQFFKSYEEETPRPKKNKEATKRSLDTSDPEELRDVVIDILTNPVKETTYLENLDKRNKFPRQELTKDINSVLSKYKFKIDRMAEREAVGIFINNLQSISKM